MPEKIDLYEPINNLKKLAGNIWIADGPVIHFKGFPFPTRMTVIRLGSGDLFVHSPIGLTAELGGAIDRLGPVRHLVSPNRIHYWWIGEWGTRYRDATKWASPGARRAAAKQGWRFDRDLGEGPDEAWAEEVDQLIVRASRFLAEVVFFHKPSRTLILADLIENFEPSRVHSRLLRGLMRIGGVSDPDGSMPLDLRLGCWGRRGQMRRALERMIAWAPERIVLAHGRCYETGGVAELRRAFRWIRGLDEA